ncbi:hypothetical protein Poli38472_003922 [Pythium oligandrum]|uniref:Uncharacterized protein n=1 Tax=Pythium oligandrum TaxID=41045 RepID=A0A8K1CMB1_PYTOL|nr:hypothetical protein Poli38472_003922 [Pythium oligandrum]|eukprot:TMW66157.1 hypothetical protein Poli38472_003922 [Pythium oligandrum]
MATGETNLSTLLRSMAPELHEGDYVITNVTPKVFATLDTSSVLCMFRESPSDITVVLGEENAKRFGLPTTPVFGWITLTIHSSLEAVGLTAAFSNALGAAGISCNVIAAYYHDHIFVPKQDAQRAIEVLQELARFHGADN